MEETQGNTKNGKELAARVALVVLTLVMAFSFCTNCFGVADETEFWMRSKDSEDLVLARVLLTRQEGFFSNGGLLQRESNWKRDQENAWEREQEQVVIGYSYPSQIGLQGFAYGFLDMFLPFRNATILQILYAITALFLAAAIALFAFFARKEFGWGSAFFVMLGCMFAPWVVQPAKNLYWVIWTLLLPFLAMWAMQKAGEKKPIRTLWFFGAAFAAVFVRAACGYEFLSVVLVSLELPALYFAIKNRWQAKKYLTHATAIGSAGLLAFLAAVCINLAQRAAVLGGWQAAWSNFLHNINNRTGVFGYELDAYVQGSIDTPFVEALKLYFLRNEPALFGLTMRQLLGTFAIACLVMLVLLAAKAIAPQYRRKMAALLAITLVSFAGVLSWFVLVKGHCVVHYRVIDFFLLYPALLLVLAFFAFSVQAICASLWARMNKKRVSIA